MVVGHPVHLGPGPPGGAEAEQAGGDDAELEEDDSCTGGDDDWPGGAHHLTILVISPDKHLTIMANRVINEEKSYLNYFLLLVSDLGNCRL